MPNTIENTSRPSRLSDHIGAKLQTGEILLIALLQRALGLPLLPRPPKVGKIMA